MKNPILEMIEKSFERLESAEILLKSKQYADSISRSYYAVLDAARAILVLKKIFPKSHAGTIAQFNRYYIKTELFPKSFSKLLAKIEKSRTEADYSFEISFSKLEAEEVLKSAQLFVDQINKYITNHVK